MSLQIDSNRFRVDETCASTQLFVLYKKRLEQISPLIRPNLPDPYCPHFNEVIPGQNCSIIGVIYKELAKRKDILESYKEIGISSQNQEFLTTSEDDKIYIEDSTGRLSLKDVDPQSFLTGVILGLYGHSEGSKFHVVSIHEPTISPSKPLSLSPGYTVMFISELACNSKSLNKVAAKNLANAMKQSSLCVLLGNNFETPEKPDPNEILSFQVRMQMQKNMPIQQLKSFLSMAACKTIIMPGANDPTTSRLPQQPYHRCLITNEQHELATNPAFFKFQDVTFLCGAGESPVDITNTTNLTFHEAQTSLLRWCHYAPSAPDHLPCIPTSNTDLLVINEMPNVFVCGLADKFEVSKFYETIVISVPSFLKTHSAVLFDMGTGEAQVKCFLPS